MVANVEITREPIPGKRYMPYLTLKNDVVGKFRQSDQRLVFSLLETLKTGEQLKVTATFLDRQFAIRFGSGAELQAMIHDLDSDTEANDDELQAATDEAAGLLKAVWAKIPGNPG